MRDMVKFGKVSVCAALFTVAVLFLLFFPRFFSAAEDGRMILIVTKDQSDTTSQNPTRLQVAAELALEDFQKNRENSRKIVHKYITYMGYEKEGYLQAKAFLEKNPSVIALVGDFNSTGTEYTARLAAEHQIPHLSFFSTEEEIFRGKPWSFSYRPRIQHESAIILQILREHLGSQKVIIIASDQQVLFTRAEDFYAAGSKSGLEIVDYHIFPAEKYDYREEIDQLVTLEEQFDSFVLFLEVYQLEHFLQQISLAGLDKPTLTTGTVIHPDLLSEFEGVDHSLFAFVPRLYLRLDKENDLQSFEQRYMVETGFHRIDSLGPWIYDGFSTLYEIMDGADNREQVMEALTGYEKEHYIGFIGFDRDGLMNKNTFVPVRVRSGKFEEL